MLLRRRPGFGQQLSYDQCRTPLHVNKSVIDHSCTHNYVSADGSMHIAHLLKRDPVVLFSDWVQNYTANVLYLVLPRMMNPLGLHMILPEKHAMCAGIIYLEKKGSYQDVDNTPDWFPKNITFRAPTHKHGISI